MSRVDAWDTQVKHEVETLHIGAARDFHSKYSVGTTLGSGGFGTVKVVTEKETGKEYACKTICKMLEEQGVGGNKQKRHLDNVRREIAVLRRLRGTLNVAQFKQVYEDDTDIHIVMEYAEVESCGTGLATSTTLRERCACVFCSIMASDHSDKGCNIYRRLLVSCALYFGRFPNATHIASCTEISNPATSCC